jgi:hypothetical protein
MNMWLLSFIVEVKGHFELKIFLLPAVLGSAMVGKHKIDEQALTAKILDIPFSMLIFSVSAAR